MATASAALLASNNGKAGLTKMVRNNASEGDLVLDNQDDIWPVFVPTSRFIRLTVAPRTYPLQLQQPELDDGSSVVLFPNLDIRRPSESFPRLVTPRAAQQRHVPSRPWFRAAPPSPAAAV
jgi:hypothetical protein